MRVGLAALVLAVPAVLACRGRWGTVRANLPVILVFGLVAVAGCQVAYFNAVSTLSIGVALLLEYSGTVLVVLWVWLRTRRAPARLTVVGGLVALVGLGLVLDITGQNPPDLMARIPLDRQPVHRTHSPPCRMQGGIDPKLPVGAYAELVRAVKNRVPGM